MIIATQKLTGNAKSELKVLVVMRKMILLHGAEVRRKLSMMQAVE